MNARTLSNKLAALALLLMSDPWTSPAAWAETQTVDTAKIEQLTGLKGKLNDKEGVFKVAVPRSDLKVTVAGVHMSPPMGLTSWAAFTKDGEQTLVMGDMVLLEEQVNPVMSVALDQGLEVTALHNHFFWDSPKVMFMHIGGRGSETRSRRRSERSSPRSRKRVRTRVRHRTPRLSRRGPHWIRRRSRAYSACKVK